MAAPSRPRVIVQQTYRPVSSKFLISAERRRRYHAYPLEFQVLNVFSTAGASILAIGYLLPIVYFIGSLRYGKIAGANPWQAAGLEWTIDSPPLQENFAEIPIVDFEAYDYRNLPPPRVEVAG